MSDLENKPVILVVDDQVKVTRFIEIDLKLRGFDVITATSGEGALKVIREAEPDIMLLDIVMPGMDGFDVLRQLRSFSQMPVIAFSASIANRDEALSLGANSFISKPFKSREMITKIHKLLKP